MPKIVFLPTLMAFTFWMMGCVDPVEPEFRFMEGLIYVDALAATEPQNSYVTISRTVQEFGLNDTRPVLDAQVYFINADSGERIALTVNGDSYLPPASFRLNVGETWELEVLMADGTQYRSLPERVPPEVPQESMEVIYDPELQYSEAFDAFVPGHEIRVTFTDTPNQENQYYWRFKSFEKLIYCHECYNQTILREEECIRPEFGSSLLKEYYTYACEGNCWRVRYNESIEIFSDEFVDGKRVSQLPVGAALLYTNDNMLIELQQFSISSNAYRYFKTLKDIIDDTGGFNAPLPAALVGNLFNVNNAEEFVLGRFTAASTSINSTFIERIFIEEPQLEQRLINSPEENEAPPPIVTSAPCVEGRNRTGIRPEGWVD